MLQVGWIGRIVVEGWSGAGQNLDIRVRTLETLELSRPAKLGFGIWDSGRRGRRRRAGATEI